MNKLTDAESLNNEKIRRKEYTKRIVNAVNYKGNDDFEDVPSILYEYQEENLNIINRQKAEIERLQDRNNKCIYLSDDETTEFCVDGACPKYKTEAMIKAEAIKEFAERLKCRSHRFKTADGIFVDCIPLGYIDNLVKEMVGR